MGKQSKKPTTKTNSAPTSSQTTATTSTTTSPAKADLGRPPFDITQQEYDDLVEQVSGLTLDELKEEWILAARYGDLDVIHAILGSAQFQAVHPPPKKPTPKTKSTDESSSSSSAAAAAAAATADTIINCQEEPTGNTALHMAAANGHVQVVRTLLQHPMIAQTASPTIHTVNHAGNTPLHWAAANGHEDTVEFLLQPSLVPDIDVLAKNQFGRSALTEGFTSENTNVVKHILEHDSAAEEKLLQGGKEIDDDNNNEESGDTEPSTAIKPNKNDIIHDFEFRTNNNNNNSNNSNEEYLRVRELPIPATQDPFGDRPELDTTGYGIWAASLVMARWMAALSERFHGKRILELGAGCGVPGLAAAYYSDANDVYVTDLNPTTLDNLNYNIQLNRQHTSTPSNKAWEDRLHAGPINWEDPETWPKDKIDYVIGSDLIYQESIVPMLKQVVLGLCQGQGTFLYVAPDTESEIGRDGLAEFIQAMEATEGCRLVSSPLAPKEYHANPLASQDDDLCFMHFHELTSAAYRLYEFQIDMKNN